MDSKLYEIYFENTQTQTKPVWASLTRSSNGHAPHESGTKKLELQSHLPTYLLYYQYYTPIHTHTPLNYTHTYIHNKEKTNVTQNPPTHPLHRLNRQPPTLPLNPAQRRAHPPRCADAPPRRAHAVNLLPTPIVLRTPLLQNLPQPILHERVRPETRPTAQELALDDADGYIRADCSAGFYTRSYSYNYPHNHYNHQ